MLDHDIIYRQLDRKAIIYNKAKGYIDDMLQDLSNPLFLADEEDFEKLYQYLVLGYKGHIKLDMMEQFLPKDYITVSIYANIAVGIVSYIAWNIYSKCLHDTNNESLLQRWLGLLIGLKIFSALTQYYYISAVSIKNTDITVGNGNMREFLDIIVMISNSFYKAMYWMLLMMVANGWHVFMGGFGRFGPSAVFCIYVFFYSYFLTDTLIDSFDRTSYVY